MVPAKMKHVKAIQIALLVVLCVVAYAPTLQNGYIWDDNSYLYENTLVSDPSGLKDIWFTHKSPQYYPLVFTTFWIEHKLWGFKAFGYHLTNLLFHIFNAILLLLVVRKIYPRVAFVVAMIFAVHPIQVETVAWITELKNVLALFFFLLTVLSYLRFSKNSTPAGYIRTFVFFTCSLLSKSVAVCFVWVPILYKWWKNGKVTLRDICAYAPFFAIGIASAINTVYVEIHGVGAKGYEFSMPLLERCVLAGRVLWFYAYKVCVPFRFVFFYPRWTIDVSEWWQWLFSVSFLGLLVFLFRSRRYIGRGAFTLLLFYAISLFPALGFINVYPMVFSFVADHFSYISMPPLLLLLCGGSLFLADKAKGMKKTAFGALCDNKIFMRGIITLMMVWLCFKSITLTADYRNETALWTSVVRKNPGSSVAAAQLGAQYELANKFDDAIPLYEKAVMLDPKDIIPYYNLGNVYMQKGDTERAIRMYNKALELDPPRTRLPDIHNNLGISYSAIGKHQLAMVQYGKAIKIDPGYENAKIKLNALAHLSEQLRVVDWTAVEREKAAAALDLLSEQQGRGGDFKEAIFSLEKAIQIWPEYARAYNNLGYIHFLTGNSEIAKEYFNKALEVDPGFEKARDNLKALSERDTSPGSSSAHKL